MHSSSKVHGGLEPQAHCPVGAQLSVRPTSQDSQPLSTVPAAFVWWQTGHLESTQPLPLQHLLRLVQAVQFIDKLQTPSPNSGG